MKTTRALASALLSTALVLTPVGVATAAPPGNTGPAAVDVRSDRDHGYGHDRHGRDHRNDDHERRNWNKEHRRDHGNDWNHRWDNQWRPNCFWFGPWLVCMPW